MQGMVDVYVGNVSRSKGVNGSFFHVVDRCCSSGLVDEDGFVWFDDNDAVTFLKVAFCSPMVGDCTFRCKDDEMVFGKMLVKLLRKGR